MSYDCKNPCEEYREFKKNSEGIILMANKSSTCESNNISQKAEKRLIRYCAMECPHPEERAKGLLQKF